jgi:hypothetical protein
MEALFSTSEWFPVGGRRLGESSFQMYTAAGRFLRGSIAEVELQWVELGSGGGGGKVLDARRFQDNGWGARSRVVLPRAFWRCIFAAGRQIILGTRDNFLGAF